jgi:HSP20 family molecular chaperone IbpA
MTVAPTSPNLEIKMTSSIEDTIKKVEVLYRSLTGRQPPPPNGAYAPVPPEADPLAHVEAQFSRLATLVAKPQPVALPTWNPRMTLWEDANDFFVEVELAGIAAKDVDVSVAQQLVTITGIRKDQPGARRVWINERNMGPFNRSVLLPPHVDANSIRTMTEKGVMQLRFSRQKTRPESEPIKSS